MHRYRVSDGGGVDDYVDEMSETLKVSCVDPGSEMTEVSFVNPGSEMVKVSSRSTL